jgi:hypothetical protein
MTEPDFGASEVAFCYLIFASNEANVRLERSSFCTSYLGDTADLIFRYGAGTPHHARTDDKACQDVRLRPPDAAPRFAGGRLEYVRGRE